MSKKDQPKGRLRNLKLREVSLVDRPANPLAMITLIKRRDADDPIVDGIMKIWYGEPQKEPPKQFAEVLRDHLVAEDQHEILEVINPLIYALDDSLTSIARDTTMSAESKQSMMRVSVEQFLATVAEKWPEAEENMSKAFKGETYMSTETKADLQKQLDELNERLEKMTAANPDAAKTAELETKVADLTKQLEEQQAAMEQAKADAEAATEKAKEEATKAALSNSEKEHLASLKEEDAKKFLAMSADDRRKAVAKALEGDEVIKVGDTEIRKSVVGDAQFAIMKAQAEELATQRKALEEQRAETKKAAEEAQLATLKKRADDEFPSLPGTTDERANVLKAMVGMDEATRKTLTEMLTAGEAAIKGAFDTIGHKPTFGKGLDDKTTDDVTKAATSFEKHIEEIAARDKISKMAAMSKARQEFPEEFKAFQAVGEQVGERNRPRAH